MSELWRENNSRDPGLELVSILDAARIMAQSLVPNTDVVFSGVKGASTDRKTIELSARDIGHEFPVPGAKVDHLLGLTVHEMGHVMFSPQRGSLVLQMRKKLNVYRGSETRILEDVISVLEDIYVDHLMTAYPGYRDYLKTARDNAIGEIKPEAIVGILHRKITRQELVNALYYTALVGYAMPSNISEDNLNALAELSTIAMKMCSGKLTRQRAIAQLWRVVSSFPETIPDEEKKPAEPQQTAPQPEPQEKEPESEEAEPQQPEAEQGTPSDSDTEEDKGEAEDKGTEENGEEDGGVEGEVPEREPETGEGDSEVPEADTETEEELEEEEPDIESDDISLSKMANKDIEQKENLNKEIAEDVSEAIVESRSDLTQMLSQLAKDSNDTVVAFTPKEDARLSAWARENTAEVEEKLRRILQDFRLKRTEDYRGLLSGKVSSRRLHRVGYGDKRVFQRREKPGEIDIAVCLLMDMSGSVHHFQPLINEVAVSISDAFGKENMEFIALGYSDKGRGICYISRLYDKEVGKPLLGVDEKAWGGTPSYEGLAAAIAQLLRLGGAKHKLLFHFTDGAPNTRGSIPELLQDARAKDIKDIHIGLGDVVDSRFQELYGTVEQVDDISELTDIIE